MLETYYRKEEAYKIPEIEDARLCEGYFVRKGIDVFTFVSKDVFEKDHFQIIKVDLKSCNYLGDTFIDFKTLSPSEQWQKIQSMLEENGLVVIKKLDH